MAAYEDRIPLYSLSVSHKLAPLEIRNRFAFSEGEQRAFLQKIKREKGLHGAVLVSTCNRTEIYFSGEKESRQRMELLFAEEKQTDVSMLRKYYRFYRGQDVIQHLFTVASGLDSMVLGEDEILGQMREAYKTADEEGCADYYIHTVFQRALSCAKQVKTDTCLSKTSVSVATLSASQVTHFKEGEKQVLLLGLTGQTGGLVAKNLAGRKDVHILATKRRHSPLELPDNVNIIPYEERYAYLDRADVVISATKSPHYTITRRECMAAMRTEKDRLFLDLAVPSDMDPDIVSLPGITLRDIDYFRTVAEEHNREKEAGSRQAEEIIRAECDEAAKELLFHDFLPRLPKWKQRFAEKRPEQLLFALKEAADARQLETLLALCDAVLEGETPRRE